MKNFIIISAPSGSGKTTLCRALQKRDESIHFSVSCTTRERRNGEMNGVDYSFLNHADFEKGIAENAFAEFEQIHGNYYYGTLKSTLDAAIQRQDLLLLELDVKGAMTIKNLLPEKTITIFVEPPSLDDLRERLVKRGTDSEERIAKRLERLGAELEYKSNFDYRVINDELNRAADEIMNIIQHENEGVPYGS
ncbi:MAG: guanylate kinase [Candidatus Marinimicrobia bacterium]|jgi:guanylate kinase|nr:guanylate kinase [Candidatus Neomarinimicrobiota bacterium]MDP6612152.1 guanylate kinase [Candidatus Neomarinimicrobiota bacterium]|tara:strand:- start:20984 stop:21562 length:579 start_codon:yes stop_codon:yes gene_type:complete